MGGVEWEGEGDFGTSSCMGEGEGPILKESKKKVCHLFIHPQGQLDPAPGDRKW